MANCEPSSAIHFRTILIRHTRVMWTRHNGRSRSNPPLSADSITYKRVIQVKIQWVFRGICVRTKLGLLVPVQHRDVSIPASCDTTVSKTRWLNISYMTEDIQMLWATQIVKINNCLLFLNSFYQSYFIISSQLNVQWQCCGHTGVSTAAHWSGISLFHFEVVPY